MLRHSPSCGDRILLAACSPIPRPAALCGQGAGECAWPGRPLGVSAGHCRDHGQAAAGVCVRGVGELWGAGERVHPLVSWRCNSGCRGVKLAGAHPAWPQHARLPPLRGMLAAAVLCSVASQPGPGSCALPAGVTTAHHPSLHVTPRPCHASGAAGRQPAARRAAWHGGLGTVPPAALPASLPADSVRPGWHAAGGGRWALPFYWKGGMGRGRAGSWPVA